MRKSERVYGPQATRKIGFKKRCRAIVVFVYIFCVYGTTAASAATAAAAVVVVVRRLSPYTYYLYAVNATVKLLVVYF